MKYKVTCFDADSNIKSEEFFNTIKDITEYVEFISKHSNSIELSWYRREFLTNEIEMVVKKIKIDDNKIIFSMK